MNGAEVKGDGLPLFAAGGGLPEPNRPFLLPGPAGALEAVLNYETLPDAATPIAVVCHPHPLYGGTMDNKVVHTVARAFVELGVLTLRFNFRGVGRSEGRFDKGVGEADDLLAAVAWLRARFGQSPLWLAGFSFGAFVACSAHRRAGAERLLLVAPPVEMFEFGDRCDDVEVPWMVIQGGADEVVAADSVARWVASQSSPPRLEWFDDAGHFFHRRLVPLRERIVQAWG